MHLQRPSGEDHGKTTDYKMIEAPPPPFSLIIWHLCMWYSFRLTTESIMLA